MCARRGCRCESVYNHSDSRTQFSPVLSRAMEPSDASVLSHTGLVVGEGKPQPGSSSDDVAVEEGEDTDDSDIYGEKFTGSISSIGLHCDAGVMNYICHQVKDQKMKGEDWTGAKGNERTRAAIWPRVKDVQLRTIYDSVEGTFNHHGMRFSIGVSKQPLLEMFASNRECYPVRYYNHTSYVPPERMDITTCVYREEDIVGMYNIIKTAGGEIRGWDHFIKTMVPKYSLITDIRRFELGGLPSKTWLEVNDEQILHYPAGEANESWTTAELRKKGELSSKSQFRTLLLKTAIRKNSLPIDGGPYLAQVAKKLRIGDPSLSPAILRAFSFCPIYGREFCRATGRDPTRCETQAKVDLSLGSIRRETILTTNSYVHALLFSCMHSKEVPMMIRIPPCQDPGQRCHQGTCAEKARKLQGQIELLLSSARLNREKCQAGSKKSRLESID